MAMFFKIPVHRLTLVMLLLIASNTGISNDVVTEVLDYEVTAVKGKLQREFPGPEGKLQVGDVEQSGALLRTGWRSAAGIQEKTFGATFELESRTRVRLAGDRPGVLLELERGKLRAIFDKIDANDSGDRIVTTPSAVLTVRGTDYAVNVDGSGHTTVVVFEGEVEVIDLGLLGPPVRLSAGTSCSVPRGRPPGQVTPHSMTSRDWNHGRMPATQLNGAGGSAGTPGGMQGGTQHRTGGGGQRHGGG